jgi:predicted RNA binding protein YcfA (HicA-like mRNA interferase family)
MLLNNPGDRDILDGLMTKKQKLIQKLLSGSRNVRFSDVQSAAEAFGFRLARVSGSHYIYIHPNIQELINLQNVSGKAKPYQVKQLLQIVERYNLPLEGE